MKILREFSPADRYVYDFGLCSIKNGFAQVDTSQDAAYFGTWANAKKLIIFCYCEGDCITTVCDTKEEFKTELLKLKAWNEENGMRFIGIDTGANDELGKDFEAVGLKHLTH